MSTPTLFLFSVTTPTHSLRVDVVADDVAKPTPRYITTLDDGKGTVLTAPLDSWDVVNLYAHTANTAKSFNEVGRRMAVFASLAVTKVGGTLAFLWAETLPVLVPPPPYIIAPSKGSVVSEAHNHCPMCGECLIGGAPCSTHGAKS